MNKEEDVVLDFEPKIFTLDKVFLLALFFVGIMYYDTRDIADLSYLFVIIYFYLRIKIYRWKKYH